MNSLACPLPDSCREAWLPFCGDWYFSVYDDFRLTLRATRRGLSLRLRNRDWDWGDEELDFIRASAEQLVINLYSFRFCARLRFYPDAARQSLLVEFTDVDCFERRDALEVPPRHEFCFCPNRADPPDWALGTWWQGECGVDFLRLARVKEGVFSLTLWSDWGVKPPTTSRRDYRRILGMPAATSRHIELVWKGADALNLRQEATLRYDFPRQCLLLEYTRRVRASRQAPQETPSGEEEPTP